MKSLSASFADLKILLNAWNMLYKKMAIKSSIYRADIHDIAAIRIQSQRKRFCKALWGDLKIQAYQAGPVHEFQLYLKNKFRTVVRLSWSDYLLQTIFAGMISKRLQNILHPQCYAYQKNKGPMRALSLMAAYIRRQINSKRQLNLYMLRTDVTSYTDSIPVGPHSVLWPMLWKLFSDDKAGFGLTEYEWRLLVEFIRPEVVSLSGDMFKHVVGIPMGSPLTPYLANLYLNPLDHVLAAVPGAFYIRYGDDMVFMHPDPRVVLEADKRMQSILDDLKLTRKKEKERFFYLTIAGRPPLPELQGNFSGTSHFSYLGYKVSARGTIAMKTEKARLIFEMLRALVRASAQLVEVKHPLERAHKLCQLLNKQLSFPALMQYKNLSKVMKYCTDRLFLRELDYELALTIAEQASFCQGKKAFSHVSYRYLRSECQLISFCQIKNKLPS